MDLQQALLGALAQEAAHGGHLGPLPLAMVLVLGHGPLLLLGAPNGQGDADAHLPHGVETTAGHEPSCDGEVGAAVQLRQLQLPLGLLHAGAGTGQLGAAGLQGLGAQQLWLRRVQQRGGGGEGIGGVMLTQTVEGRQGGPLLSLQGPGGLLQPSALQLSPQEIALTALPHFVAGAGQLLRLLQEETLLGLEGLLAPHQEQGRVGPAHVGLEAQAHPGLGGLREVHVQGRHVLAEAALAGPGQRLGEGHAVETGLHPPDLQLLETVVLDAEGQGGIRQHARLGHPLLVHAHGGVGLLEVRELRQGLLQEGG